MREIIHNLDQHMIFVACNSVDCAPLAAKKIAFSYKPLLYIM